MNRQSIVKAAVFGSVLCAALMSHAEDLPSDFASVTPLTLNGEGPWYRLELPLAVQLNARQSTLNDVRVFNTDGQAQPYALTLGEPEHEANQTPVEVKRFALYNSDDAKDAEPKIRVERSAGGTLVEV